MLLLDGPKSVLYAVAFAPDGRLAVGDKDGRLTVWDEAGQAVWRPEGSPAPVYGLTFDADGELLTCQEQVYRHRPDRTDLVLGPPVPAIALARLDDLLVVGCGSRIHRLPGELVLWSEFGTRKRLSVSERHGVRAVATHPETRQIAWATAYNRVSVWDITRPDPTHFPLPANSPSVALHPDGQTLAAAVGWQTTLFDIREKRERRTLKGHTGPVYAVAFSPDGRTLATGSWDGSVRLWEPDTGAERTAYRWPVGRVFSLAYDADGLRLAAGGDQGAVVVWDAE